MKKTIKRLLSLVLLMCVISLHNCEKDAMVAETTGEENGQNSFFSKGKLAHYSELVSYVDELKRNLKAESLSKNSDFENTNNFTILENQDVSVFTGTTSTTYTIPIRKTNQPINTFSNLVIKFSDTQATKTIILSYEPSQSYLDAMVTNDRAPYSGYVSYENVDYDGSLDYLAKGCRTVSHTYCNYGGEEHNAGSNCTPSYMWTVRTTFCDDDAIDPPPAFIDNSIGGTGGNNGSNDDNPLPNDDEIATTPLAPYQVISDCMNADSFNPRLSQETLTWLNENRNSSTAISNYLMNVGCNEQAQDFIEEAIEALKNDQEVDFDDEIIFDSSFTGKAKCIYNKLKTTSTGFKGLLKRFDGEFPVSHLTFKIDNSLVQGNYGLTYPPQNFNIAIAFSNTQLANISDLGAVVCFAHEMIHAEIFRKLLEAAKHGNLDPNTMTQQQQVDYVQSLRDDFPGLYDYYVTRYRPTWNHNMMAQHYRTVIADILEEFDNSSKPRAIYESLSWVGLRVLEDLNNSDAWDALSAADKQTIMNNLNTYFTNGESICN